MQRISFWIYLNTWSLYNKKSFKALEMANSSKMSKYLRRIAKLLRIIFSGVRVFFLRLKLPGSFISSKIYLASGIRIDVTDGGHLTISDGVNIDKNATILVKNGQLTIGKNTYIGVGSVIVARGLMSIGENGLIAEYVTVRDQDHLFDGVNTTANNGFRTAPIHIGSNVWLCAKVTVTRGVAIGNNVVVGANSVVTHDLPDNCVAAGVPAQVIRHVDRVQQR